MNKHGDGGWLSIGAAAARLGVHVNTLRRWADQGQVPCSLTPGGHRRFSEKDLERFLGEQSTVSTPMPLEQAWVDRALSRARREVVSQRGEAWMEVYDEQARQEKRELGRRLMGVLLQYVSCSQEDEGLLQEARLIGRQHALHALRVGISMPDSLQAAMFFRDTALEAALDLPQRAHQDKNGGRRLFRRINELLNEVQIAIAEVYAGAAGGDQ